MNHTPPTVRVPHIAPYFQYVVQWKTATVWWCNFFNYAVLPYPGIRTAANVVDPFFDVMADKWLQACGTDVELYAIQWFAGVFTSTPPTAQNRVIYSAAGYGNDVSLPAQVCVTIRRDRKPTPAKRHSSRICMSGVDRSLTAGSYLTDDGLSLIQAGVIELDVPFTSGDGLSTFSPVISPTGPGVYAPNSVVRRPLAGLHRRRDRGPAFRWFPTYPVHP